MEFAEGLPPAPYAARLTAKWEPRLKLLESELFHVGAFARRHAALRYSPHPSDAALLAAAAPLDPNGTEETSATPPQLQHEVTGVELDVPPPAPPPPDAPAAAGEEGEEGEGGECSPAVLLRVLAFTAGEPWRELVLHGAQPLSALRERLECHGKQSIEWQQREARKRARGGQLPAALRLSASACFCIEGNFFVSGEVDLSEAARARLQQETGAEVQAHSMEETTLEMLQLRLGRAYLFVHHGKCEHAIVFTECELASMSRRELEQFPKCDFEREPKTKKCCVCLREPSKWECHGDRLADTFPSNLCDSCHFLFHYKSDGNAQRTDYLAFRIFPT
ncbi:hypothetical protein AB1Y20_015994 [Prymnesium parvum]|uniref:snRNA-activating protein complex subunit 3 n=1 Tax=Prymnesium parvum TaxID=97485 RepID=A0AB34K236_PRYPA